MGKTCAQSFAAPDLHDHVTDARAQIGQEWCATEQTLIDAFLNVAIIFVAERKR